MGTSDFSALADCELVIEAVYEDRAVKADAVVRRDMILATNTWTLPISGLAGASARPQNLIGPRFFSVAERMPLVEIIRGDRTSASRRALRAARVAEGDGQEGRGLLPTSDDSSLERRTSESSPDRVRGRDGGVDGVRGRLF